LLLTNNCTTWGEELVWANHKFEAVIFLMGEPRSASTSSKALANTWTVQDWMTFGLRHVYIQPTPLRLCRMTKPTTVLSEYIYLYKKLSGTLSGQFPSYCMAMNMMWQLKSSLKVWVRCQRNTTVLTIEQNSTLQTSVLRSEEVESLMEEFDQAHSDNPNFTLWAAYVSTVEILLDFIRAEMDGN